MRTRVAIAALVTLGAWLARAPVDASPRRRPTASAAATYGTSVRRWHDAAQCPGPRTTDDGRMILRLHSINGLGSAELTPRTRDGGFDEAACAEVSRVLGDSRTQHRAPIDRRLIEILYMVARHFHAGQITVVSGFRDQRQPSNHRHGRAVDIIVPGVSDRAVAEYARTLGFVGVGVYPSSGFTHIDVRSSSYFWVDGAGPARARQRGRRGRRRRSRGGIQQILGDLGRRMDVEARGRGVFPLGGFAGASVPGNGSASASGIAHPGGESDGEDDDDEGAAPRPMPAPCAAPGDAGVAPGR